MDDEKLALYTFGFSFLVAVVYGVVVSVGELNGVVGVFLLFVVLVFIYYSDRVVDELIVG